MFLAPSLIVQIILWSSCLWWSEEANSKILHLRIFLVCWLSSNLIRGCCLGWMDRAACVLHLLPLLCASYKRFERTSLRFKQHLSLREQEQIYKSLSSKAMTLAARHSDGDIRSVWRDLLSYCTGINSHSHCDENKVVLTVQARMARAEWVCSQDLSVLIYRARLTSYSSICGERPNLRRCLIRARYTLARHFSLRSRVFQEITGRRCTSSFWFRCNRQGGCFGIEARHRNEAAIPLDFFRLTKCLVLQKSITFCRINLDFSAIPNGAPYTSKKNSPPPTKVSDRIRTVQQILKEIIT